MKKKYDYAKAMAGYEERRNERSEWEAEWREISEHLLPGRGVYQTYSKPRKRKLTSGRIINSVAEDSLYVLTSGMHGGLTSPSRPWFKLSWSADQLNKIEPLKQWLQNSEDKLHKALHASNFYSIINSFYTEYAGFGTGCVYIGEDSGNPDIPFRFELLTVGEYAYSVGADGLINAFNRTIFMTARQLVEKFPKTASAETKKRVKDNEAGVDTTYITVLECVYKEKYMDKDYTQVFYEVASGSSGASSAPSAQEPLSVSGFYEFPYPVGRWGTIGSDIYGVGPGSRALPDIKRLQEMEKAFLMATHKSINPPLNAPARMRGKLNTLPGGYNYYSNPNEQVNQIYQVNFDYGGVSAAVERVEQRIQRNFFNDIFLTASRDPNASPLKARQVDAQDQEKMLRLGPVIERLQHEFLQPLLARCFNIMLRKEMFDPLPADLAKQVGDYNITMISPLATAQRSIALQGTMNFMGFLGQAAQFDQTILDNIDVDAAARDVADINGVKLGILRPEADVKAKRLARAKAQMAQDAKQDAMARAQVGSQVNAETAGAQKTQAEAGQILLESQQTARDMGIQ